MKVFFFCVCVCFVLIFCVFFPSTLPQKLHYASLHSTVSEADGFILKVLNGIPYHICVSVTLAATADTRHSTSATACYCTHVLFPVRMALLHITETVNSSYSPRMKLRQISARVLRLRRLLQLRDQDAV